MPSKGTPIRSVRVPDPIWLPAKAKAEANGTSATEVMVAALIAYLAED